MAIGDFPRGGVNMGPMVPMGSQGGQPIGGGRFAGSEYAMQPMAGPQSTTPMGSQGGQPIGGGRFAGSEYAMQPMGGYGLGAAYDDEQQMLAQQQPQGWM